MACGAWACVSPLCFPYISTAVWSFAPVSDPMLKRFFFFFIASSWLSFFFFFLLHVCACTSAASAHRHMKSLLFLYLSSWAQTGIWALVRQLQKPPSCMCSSALKKKSLLLQHRAAETGLMSWICSLQLRQRHKFHLITQWRIQL